MDKPGRSNLFAPQSPTAQKYTKLRVLGEGTYGTVYKAISEPDGRLVAVKKLHLGSAKDGVPTTTIRELAALQELSGSDNIVTMHNFKFEYSSNLCKPKLLLELEFCEFDLRQFAKRFPQRRLPIAVTAKITRDIIKATAYCHDRRFIHRDLKCSNILIKFHGDPESLIELMQLGEWDDEWFTVKIADFGLARTQYELGGPLTHEVITLWYRAPEILLGINEYGTPVDIWSIGCIIAELLYGRPIFCGDNEIHTLFKIFEFLGTPDESTWKRVCSAPEYKPVWPVWKPRVNRWQMLRENVSTDEELFQLMLDVCDRCLVVNPECRASAKELCHHELFGHSDFW